MFENPKVWPNESSSDLHPQFSEHRTKVEHVGLHSEHRIHSSLCWCSQPPLLGQSANHSPPPPGSAPYSHVLSPPQEASQPCNEDTYCLIPLPCVLLASLPALSVSHQLWWALCHFCDNQLWCWGWSTGAASGRIGFVNAYSWKLGLKLVQFNNPENTSSQHIVKSITKLLYTIWLCILVNCVISRCWNNLDLTYNSVYLTRFFGAGEEYCITICLGTLICREGTIGFEVNSWQEILPASCALKGTEASLFLVPALKYMESSVLCFFPETKGGTLRVVFSLIKETPWTVFCMRSFESCAIRQLI